MRVRPRLAHLHIDGSPFRAETQAEEAQGAIATARVTVWAPRGVETSAEAIRQQGAAFSLPLSGHTENPLRGAV